MINKITNSLTNYKQYKNNVSPSFGMLKLNIKNRDAEIISTKELPNEKERKLMQELITLLKRGEFNFIGCYKKPPSEYKQVFDSNGSAIILTNKISSNLPEIDFLPDKTHTYTFQQSSVEDTFFYKTFLNLLWDVRNYDPGIKSEWVNPNFYDNKYTYVDFANKKVNKS